MAHTGASPYRWDSVGLLEREDQLATLAGTLAEARDAGRLVLVAGEAGAGKTALVEELRARHLADHRLLIGRCDDLFAARPLGPLTDIARAVGGQLAAALETGDRGAVFDAFLGELMASEEPVVVVLEDLQWADEATLDLVRFVARRLDVLRCLVIATYRDDLPPDHPLRRAWGSLVGPLVTRLSLAPLSPSAVAVLAEGSGLDPASLHARTGGNPFFVVEVLATEAAGLPSSVRDMVLARAAHLLGPARDCLDAAAVLGRHATIRHVCEVGDCDEAAIDECIAAGLLHSDDERVLFRHDLARETIEVGLSPLRRRQLHRRALDALRASDDIVQQAHHALGSGDREVIVDLAPRAGDACVGLGAFKQAAALYAGALEHEDALSPAEHVRTLQAYADACMHLDRTADAVAAGDRAHALLLDVGDQAAIGSWESSLAAIYWAADRGEAATELAANAVRRLAPLGTSQALARAICAHASHLMLSGRFAEAIVEGRRGLELAERFDDDEAVLDALNACGASMCCLGDMEGATLLQEAIDRAKRAELPRVVCRTSANLGEVHRAAADPARALAVFADGLAVAEEHELLYRRNCLLVTRSLSLLLLDRWDDVVADAQTILGQSDIASHHRGMALTALGQVRARRGDPGVDEVLDEALRELDAIGDAQYVHLVRVGRAEAAWLAGDEDRARAEIEALLPLLHLLDNADVRLVLQWAARLGVDRPERFAGGEGSPVPDVAIVGHRAVAEFWAARGCSYAAADVLADSDDVSDLLEAHERLLALGAAPRAHQVAHRLRDRGAAVPRGPRASTRANAAGLTSRELEVAKLLADGLTNADIAQKLVLSPKTVDHHVSAVLSKLGVNSRRHVARAAEHFQITLA